MGDGLAVKAPGDRIELGDIIGHGLEPDLRWARLVGIRKGADVRPMDRYILRCYEPGDPDDRPTGSRVTTWLLVPWTGRKR